MSKKKPKKTPHQIGKEMYLAQLKQIEDGVMIIPEDPKVTNADILAELQLTNDFLRFQMVRDSLSKEDTKRYIDRELQKMGLKNKYDVGDDSK